MNVLDNPKYSYLVGRQPIFFRIWKTLFYFYSRVVFTIYTPLKVFGQENIPKTSFIFCSNHNSHMDVALLSAAAEKSFNYFGMLAAKDYWFDSWVKRNLVNTVMNLIPIDRKVGGIRQFSIEDTLTLCKTFMDYQHRNLIFFPEGTRGAPGVMNAFKKGAASFALNLDIPILPAVIHGSHKSWPKDKIFMRPAAIRVYILEPLYPGSFLDTDNPGDNDLANAAQEMTMELERRITEKVKNLYE